MSSDGAIGILGGTFDPIHHGHLGAAAVVGRALDLDRVLLMPASVPPHRQAPLVSVYHRFAMVALAAMSADRLVASDLDLDRPGPSYTAALLDRVLGLGHRRSQIVFITGADAFAEIATWYDYPAVLDRCHFAVVSRPGFAASDLPARLPDLADRFAAVPNRAGGPSLPLPATPRILLIDAATPDVSSTEIRARLRGRGTLSDLMPERVAEYVRRHGLYLDA
jgi:nicotinate-nucleotide adenylyltransferase